METEPSPPVVAKKLWKIMRVVFYMLGKGISKNKLMDDLQMMLKRGQIAGKAMGNLMLHHNYSALTCRSDDPHLSFISPREYEFSFRNSPAYASYYTRRKHHHHLHRRHRHLYHNADVVHKVFDMLNSEVGEASPVALPGFGRSPTVRQLRVTDSPFPLTDLEDDCSDQVNKAAEDFINKFYKELKQQQKIAALQSPSQYHLWTG